MSKKNTGPVHNLRLDLYNMSVETNSSRHQCFNDTASDDLFILKRIMVRKICFAVWFDYNFFFFFFQYL